MRFVGFRGLLSFVALAALTLGILQGVGSAAAPSRATAPIQWGNTSCGDDWSSALVVGQVKFVRQGDTIKVSVTVKNTIPYVYDVALWGVTGTDTCEGIADWGTISANKRGTARGSFSTTYSGPDTQFFVGVWYGGTIAGGNTPAVSFP